LNPFCNSGSQGNFERSIVWKDAASCTSIPSGAWASALPKIQPRLSGYFTAVPSEFRKYVVSCITFHSSAELRTSGYVERIADTFAARAARAFSSNLIGEIFAMLTTGADFE